MEHRFVIEPKPDRRCYRDFGSLHLQRSKAQSVFFWIELALMALCIYSALFHGELVPSLVAFSVIMYLYWLLGDLLVGSSASRNAKSRLQNTPTRITVTDTHIVEQSVSSSSTVDYSRFLGVVEGDLVFALYVARGVAILFPKADFTEGTVDDFRAFITQKVGPVRRIKNGKKRRILGIALGVCYIAALLSGFCLNKAWNERATLYQNGAYSICLPGSFTPSEDTQFHMELLSEDVLVYVFEDSQDDLLAYGYDNLDTVSAYAEEFVVWYELEDYTASTLKNGTLCLTYHADVDGETFYYCDALVQADDGFWITEFVCNEADWEVYEPLFLNWAQSITIAE